MPIFPIGRKAKDQKDLKAAGINGGTVVIRSKNKIANPNDPSQTLGRGSTVTVKRAPSLTMDKPTVTPGVRSVSVKKTTTEKYQPGDMQGNKIHDRPTTPELGRSLGEDPGKTKLRIDAQAQGKSDYSTRSGKKEYAGRTIKRDNYETSTTKAPDVVTPGKIHVSMKKSYDVKPVKTQTANKKSSGRSGLVIHRSAGTNNQGRPQNYTSIELGGKKLLKFRSHTPGSRKR